MSKKRKGFTLVELLAVIVILSVIAFITIPMIMGVIEKSKKQAFLNSAYGIIESGEYFYAEHILNDKNQAETRYDFEVKNNKFVYTRDNTKELTFKGEVPKLGILQINSNGKTAIAICNNAYCACKSINELQVSIKSENCGINSETGEIENGSSITSAQLEELTNKMNNLEQEIIDSNQKIELLKIGNNPSGTIISYIAGNEAPKGYLLCDGSVYNINDYPTLAESIKNGFGTYNYYGGDGTTTFAVPDLRGEFLRGTGTNSHENQGNGAKVGLHQDAILIPQNYFETVKGNQWVFKYETSTNKNSIKNPDSIIGKVNDVSNFVISATGTSSSGSAGYALFVRPTNTSVLYCIKI